jgi:hypothetical protein
MAALSPDGRTVAAYGTWYDKAGNHASEVRFWDAETGIRVATVGAAGCVGWSADGQLVVAGATAIRKLQIPNGAETARWPISADYGIGFVRFPPGGRFLVERTRTRWPSLVRWLSWWLPGDLVDLNQPRTVAYSVRSTFTGKLRGEVVMDREFAIDAARQAAETEAYRTANAHFVYDLVRAMSLASAVPGYPDRGRDAAEAVAFLRQVIPKGLVDIPQLLADPAFAPLRGRPDYNELLWDLADTPAHQVKP